MTVENSGTTRKPQAFTLIELLVVIAIIALLIGILFPVLGRARDVTKAALCKNHMRQLFLATQMYTNDHEGYLPQPAHDQHFFTNEISGAALWYNALDYHLQQLAKDYARGDTDERNYRKFKHDPIWETWDEATRKKNVTIKMNDYFGHGSTASTPSGGASTKFYRFADAPRPSNTVLYVDGRAEDTPSVTTGNTGGSTLFYARPIYVGLRHEDGANIAFADGHGAHHINPIKQSSTGYRGWFDDDDSNPANRPDVVFNFRP